MSRIAALSRAFPFSVIALVLAAEVQGTLQTVDPVGGQIVFGNGSALALNADTQIWVNGRQGTLTDLQPGEKISAEVQSEDGQNVATRIDVSPGNPSRLVSTDRLSDVSSHMGTSGHRRPLARTRSGATQ